MIRSTSRKLLSSWCATRQQTRLKSTATGESSDDLKSIKHIPSVTLVEEEDEAGAAAVALKEDRDPVMIMKNDIFNKYTPKNVTQTRQVWVESLDESDSGLSKDLIPLHPDVWSVKPRLDILWQNIDWQLRYKRVDYDVQKDSKEMHYGGRPWPQKGSGRARHRSRTSPIWNQGGKTHPNRGIKGHYYMLQMDTRIQGLTHALSTKLAQDDLRVVKDLHIPSTDPDYIDRLIDDRCWGISALICDVSDFFPENLTAATEPIQHVNLMPCYGLNVHSILKHKTLVLTVDAVNYLEEKLLYAMNRSDYAQKRIKSSTSGYSLF